MNTMKMVFGSDFDEKKVFSLCVDEGGQLYAYILDKPYLVYELDMIGFGKRTYLAPVPGSVPGGDRIDKIPANIEIVELSEETESVKKLMINVLLEEARLERKKLAYRNMSIRVNGGVKQERLRSLKSLNEQTIQRLYFVEQVVKALFPELGE